MKYLLDTCCISDFVNGRGKTIDHVDAGDSSHLSVSNITVMEIEYGFALTPGRARQLRQPTSNFLQLCSILPFSQAMAEIAGSIRAELHRLGTPIGAYDLLIAATALHHRLTLVTSNTSEFARIDGITLENWR